MRAPARFRAGVMPYDKLLHRRPVILQRNFKEGRALRDLVLPCGTTRSARARARCNFQSIVKARARCHHRERAKRQCLKRARTRAAAMPKPAADERFTAKLSAPEVAINSVRLKDGGRARAVRTNQAHKARGPIERNSTAPRPPNCIVQSRSSRSESIGAGGLLSKQKCGASTCPAEKSLWSCQHENDQKDRVDQHPIFQKIVDQLRERSPEKLLVCLRNKSQRLRQQRQDDSGGDNPESASHPAQNHHHDHFN